MQLEDTTLNAAELVKLAKNQPMILMKSGKAVAAVEPGKMLQQALPKISSAARPRLCPDRVKNATISKGC